MKLLGISICQPYRLSIYRLRVARGRGEHHGSHRTRNLQQIHLFAFILRYALAREAAKKYGKSVCVSFDLYERGRVNRDVGHIILQPFFSFCIEWRALFRVALVRSRPLVCQKHACFPNELFVLLS